MNEFEKRMNALRIQYKNERKQIQKDAYRTIGHLNNAIGQVSTQEAREALRAEKQRVYEAMRNSHKYNKLCYRQQLETLEEEYSSHLETNPSGRQIRRMLRILCRAADAKGEKSLTFSIGMDSQATINFN